MRALVTILTMLGLAFIGLMFAATVQMRSEVSFGCAYTGSRYGYTISRAGHKSREWYQKSALEDFIEKKHPDELKHDWQLKFSIGRNAWGGRISCGCGASGRVAAIPLEFIADYCASVSDKEKLETYRALMNATPDEARKLADTILDRATDAWQSGTKSPATTVTNANHKG
jgi:hypothetical protein